MPDNASREETVTATVELGLPGAKIKVRLTVPSGPTRASEIIETCRTISEAITEVAVGLAEQQGERVSCKAGCGACCRQLVPVAEPEARRLVGVIEAMDEPRRTEVKERFAAAREKLAEAGLLAQIADTDRFPYEAIQQFGDRYFALGIPCPLLEEESCSIYTERPLSCREYLVTSAPEHCRRPAADTIKMIRMPARTSTALARVNLPKDANHARWVPLIAVLDWMAAHGDESAETTGPSLLEDLFSKLSGSGD